MYIRCCETPSRLSDSNLNFRFARHLTQRAFLTPSNITQAVTGPHSRHVQQGESDMVQNAFALS
jgi:hypothetical protein